MVSYEAVSNATLSTVLTELATLKVASTRIVNIFHDGSAYVAVYVTTI